MVLGKLVKVFYQEWSNRTYLFNLYKTSVISTVTIHIQSKNLNNESIYGGKYYENIFMISYIQMNADKSSILPPVYFDNG